MSKNMIDQLCSMTMNRRAGHVSPHKAVMMLAVIDLVAAGDAKQNRFVYGPEGSGVKSSQFTLENGNHV